VQHKEVGKKCGTYEEREERMQGRRTIVAVTISRPPGKADCSSTCFAVAQQFLRFVHHGGKTMTPWRLLEMPLLRVRCILSLYRNSAPRFFSLRVPFICLLYPFPSCSQEGEAVHLRGRGGRVVTYGKQARNTRTHNNENAATRSKGRATKHHMSPLSPPPILYPVHCCAQNKRTL
jgi:hypothetical protein